MAQFFDLDSAFRDVCQYPNPACYELTYNQIKSWFPSARTVIANSPNPSTRSVEFTQSVKVLLLYLPYTTVTYITNPNDPIGSTVTINTADIQRLYLDVHTINKNDGQAMFTINNIPTSGVRNARFVLKRDNIQLDSNGVPRWLLFKCDMDQVMRIDRDKALSIRILQEQGYQIIISDTDPVTLANQTYINLQIMPYFLDANFRNNGIGLISNNAY
jgi:hypothetical protein